MTNQNIFVGVIVGILALGVFLFFQPEKVNSPEEEIVAETKVAENDNEAANDPLIEVAENDNEAVKKAETTGEENKADIDSFEDQIIYYYSLTCGHCEKVNEFLEENNISSKVDFAKKEVSQSMQNGKELAEAAQKCGIDPGRIGVPFLFAYGKCYMGGPDVEGFFKKEAGLL